ncbi:MAG: hypothetical protein ACR2N3_11395 [Pyrinomonadaceae bacterium]
MDKHPKILPFDMKIAFFLIILFLLLFIGGLFVSYIVDDVKTVPFNERSYPPPKSN